MLVRWKPFDEFFNLYRDIDNLFRRSIADITRELSEFTSEQEFRWPFAGLTVPVESFVDQGKLNLRLELPGVDPKDVEVNVSGNQLTVRGKKSFDRKVEDKNYFHREIAYGSFERTIQLPEGVDVDKIEATYHNGVLEITMPAPAALEARKVEVKVLEAPKAAAAK
ncbi:MAG TPA: Hsp20/alpha crystallin family protein [Blastocatellia bacterium]|nr:Hsp20/alpha crystallin family protein [Blastocatellia bacterium]